MVRVFVWLSSRSSSGLPSSQTSSAQAGQTNAGSVLSGHLFETPCRIPAGCLRMEPTEMIAQPAVSSASPQSGTGDRREDPQGLRPEWELAVPAGVGVSCRSILTSSSGRRRADCHACWVGVQHHGHWPCRVLGAELSVTHTLLIRIEEIASVSQVKKLRLRKVKLLVQNISWVVQGRASVGFL